MTRAGAFLLLLVLAARGAAVPQEPGVRVPSVDMAPVGRIQVKPGSSTTVQLDFRVADPFHINSNKPKSELLIPTALQLNALHPLSVGPIKYPPGQDQSFPFAPGEKLSVYSGDFAINVVVKAAAGAASGTYSVSGDLRFQACDRSACYPPRTTPVKFAVSIAEP